MAKRYAVRRSIEAPADRVWRLLTAADQYTRWNPTVLSLEGRIAAGEKIKLVSTANPKRAFALTVSDVAPGSSMVWSSGMPLGLFSGRRTFTLEPASSGGTEFAMEEIYRGALAPLITSAIPDLTDTFAQFADGLKAEAEAIGQRDR